MRTLSIAPLALAGLVTSLVARAQDEAPPEETPPVWRGTPDDGAHALPPLALPADAAQPAAAPPPPPPPPPPAPYRPPAETYEPREPAKGYGVGGTLGLSTGVGASFRVPMGSQDRLWVTLFPVYTRESPFFSGGVRWQRIVRQAEHVKFYSAAGAAVYLFEDDRAVAPGIGFGMETGGESYSGIAWWGDLTATAMISDYGLEFAAIMPQTGLMIVF